MHRSELFFRDAGVSLVDLPVPHPSRPTSPTSHRDEPPYPMMWRRRRRSAWRRRAPPAGPGRTLETSNERRSQRGYQRGIATVALVRPAPSDVLGDRDGRARRSTGRRWPASRPRLPARSARRGPRLLLHPTRCCAGRPWRRGRCRDRALRRRRRGAGCRGAVVSAASDECTDHVYPRPMAYSASGFRCHR